MSWTFLCIKFNGVSQSTGVTLLSLLSCWVEPWAASGNRHGTCVSHTIFYIQSLGFKKKTWEQAIPSFNIHVVIWASGFADQSTELQCIRNQRVSEKRQAGKNIEIIWTRGSTSAENWAKIERRHTEYVLGGKLFFCRPFSICSRTSRSNNWSLGNC